MGDAGLSCYIAGNRLAPEAGSPRIVSYDQSETLAVAETSSVQLRRALRYADDSQPRVRAIPFEQRVEDARLVMREYERRIEEASRALAQFRGLTVADTRWMSQVNLRWGEQFEGLAEAMFGGGPTREVRPLGRRTAALSWQSKGPASLFSSSTMDGPPAVVSICHAMLSGTHLICKPSFRDTATHLVYEILYDHGLHHYGQLVRWRSEHPDADRLNRQLIAHMAQNVIFSSNETFQALLDGVAKPGSEEWAALHARTKRYGTGLPLGVVTGRGDLERAARDLVEGARLGGGRFCLSVCPVLVEKSAHDALLARVVERAQHLRRGSPLQETTELSSHDPASSAAMRSMIAEFGGRVAFGEVRDMDMDVVVLADVPATTSALYRELPGTALALIPVEDVSEVVALANTALRRNGREAWTAITMFGAEDELERLQRDVASYRYLRGGVVAQVNLLLPHQGSYFALDLMRRVAVE
jgi:acyl-CoA reductase-like NAD-dependent aldehyde dehydrogenase